MTRNRLGSPVLWIAAALLIVAAVPRTIDLGELAFYGDEETMAMPAYSLATGQGAAMPSGMPYHRALPLTWLNALAARWLGTDQEIAYRLPAAVLSTLMVPVLFLLLRPFVGTGTAVVAAFLLAMSEWHLITSREARMYGPFLLCYTSCVLAGWHWLVSRSSLWMLATVVLFLATISLQVLGLPATVVLLMPLLFGRAYRVSWPLAVSVSGALGGLALYYRKNIVNGPPLGWRRLVDQSALPDLGFGLTYQTLAQQVGLFDLTMLMLGTGAGAWLAWRVIAAGGGKPTALWLAAMAVLGIGVGTLALTGQLHGAAMAALIMTLMHPLDGRALARKAAAPAIILVLVAAVWAAAAIARLGIVEGMQSVLMYPFPYVAYFFEMFPVVTVLFLLTSAGVAVTGYDADSPQGLRYCVLAALIPLVAVGLLRDWGGVRYVFAAYPFVLAVAAAGLLTVLRFALDRMSVRDKNLGPVIAIVLITLGFDPGHGMMTAWRVVRLDYGLSLDEWALGFPLYPDHAGPGRFVRENATADDIIVAEDALQQHWYAGRVDLWLRDPDRTDQFLYLGKDGRQHDIYVNSVALTKDAMDELLGIETRCIWVISSAETEHRRHDYLNGAQREWLNDVVMKGSPVFTGRDGTTRVYLLNCATPDGLK